MAGFLGTLSAGDSDFGGIGGLADGSARGVVRAKTGNLSTVATLAGLVYDRGGRLLLFAIMAPQVPAAGLLQNAADAIDSAAAGLADAAAGRRRGRSACGLHLPLPSASTYGRTVSSAQMIDWDTAISTGVRFARQGPQVSLTDARAVVAELRGLTTVVQQPVREVTGLTSQGAVGPVAVVDRPGWIRANVGGFHVVLEPLAEKLAERGNPVPVAGPLIGSVGARVTGVQAGLILAYLSSRVLGQYELFLPPGEGDPPPTARTAPATATAPRRAPASAASPWSRRTSSWSSASSASTRTTSGAGSACTRRRTGCSSPRCPGCAATCRA